MVCCTLIGMEEYLIQIQFVHEIFGSERIQNCVASLSQRQHGLFAPYMPTCDWSARIQNQLFNRLCLE